MLPWYSMMFHDWRSRPNGAQSSSPYEPPADNFDEDAARRHAQRQAMAALTGGMLSTYLSGGQQPIGRAFELQRGAYDDSMERERAQAEHRMAVERQRQMDASAEEERRARVANYATDNERAQREVEARATAAETKRKTDEAEQARIAAQRERLLKDNPEAASFDDEQVKHEYGQRYGYHTPDKPVEHWDNGRRATLDPATGKWHVEQVMPREAASAKPTTPAELRAQRSEERRLIEDQADIYYKQWLSSQNDYRPATERAKAAAQVAAHERAQKEFYSSNDADTPTSTATSPGTSTPSVPGKNARLKFTADGELIDGSTAEQSAPQATAKRDGDASITALRAKVAAINSGRVAPTPTPKGKPVHTISDMPVSAFVTQIESRIHRKLTPAELAQAIQAQKSGATTDELVKHWLFQ